MRASAVAAALVVASGLAAVGLRGSRAGAGAHETARLHAEPSAAAVRAGDDEAQRLRAELQTKDRIIRELAAQGAVKDATLAATIAAQRDPGHDREEAGEHAREVLDARLAAPSAPGLRVELEHALDAAVDSTVLGATRVASRQCGGAMCRVAVTADSAATMNASLEAMLERLPKTFSATAIYDAPDGARVVYLARSNEDLATKPL